MRFTASVQMRFNSCRGHYDRRQEVTGKAWERRVRAEYDFLLESGFRFEHVDDGVWATAAVYLSSTLGVEVTRSAEFGRVEISLLRLVDGQLPEHEIWVTERPINRMLFDNVLLARAPHLLEKVPTGLSTREVDRQLRLWAELLRSVAPDFLEGDDAPIVEAEQVIRQRVAEHPQELTIWLPSDASSADEERARVEAQGTAPRNVRITVRRYAR
jgi:hypothetical protein